jgi:hypothetical protein
MEGTMSKIITLPSGATAKMRDPATLLMKDRNKVLAVANEQEGMMQAVALQNGLIAVMVVEWSFDLIPPSIKITSLDELTPLDYAALSEEAIKAQDYLFPNIAEGNPDDPKVITANSNA